MLSERQILIIKSLDQLEKKTVINNFVKCSNSLNNKHHLFKYFNNIF